MLDEAWRGGREALQRVAHHLVDAENHHQREEDALFPRLERLGIREPSGMMREDHEEFRARKRRLYQLVNAGTLPAVPAERVEVIAIGEFLVRELADHIQKEDNVVYQVAHEAIATEEWVAVKRECDALGYCCFKPADQRDTGSRDAALDVRFVPMHRRLETVLDAWRALAPGATLRLTVDHEPRPLRALFAGQEAATHEWSWEKNGPPEWVVAMRRKP
jgi:uncharacterized protein (DUF2249 family)/iron-sulfur cluster repair protein YtfE (RIC family)